MARPFRTAYRAKLLALAVCAATAANAPGTSRIKHDRSPRTPHLLADATRFIAQDRWDGLTLYRTADGSAVRSFFASMRMGASALSPDESLLLVGSSGGALILWRVETGEPVWRMYHGARALRPPEDVGFAGDGGRFVVCRGDHVVVFETQTGRAVDVVTVPSKQHHIVSAALNPDGTRGVLIAEGLGLCRFDVGTGRTAVGANLAARGLVRFSAGGEHVAFPTRSWGLDPQLSVISAGDGPPKRALGRFADIGRVRPLPDGSFLVTAQVSHQYDDAVVYAGTQIWPDGRVREVWRLTPRRRWSALLPESISPHRVNHRTDFLPGPMIGVSTDGHLVTTVTDLRTGEILRTIDSGVSWLNDPDVIPSAGSDPRFLILVACGAAVAVGGWWVWRRGA